MIKQKYIHWNKHIWMQKPFSRIRNAVLTLIIGSMLYACQSPSETLEVSSADYHKAVDKLTEVIIHDIFSPPVASRIYNYPNIAAYEVIRQEKQVYPSLAGQLRELTPIPQANTKKSLNYKVAALVAYIEVGKTLIFSEARINTYRDSLYQVWEAKNPKTFEDAKSYGLQVADHIKKWMATDQYAQTRTMPKFSINTEDPSRWQPTPPDYMDGIEPHWREIRPMVMTSPAQFTPKTYPAFSLEKESPFFKEVLETYSIGKQIKEEGEASEKLQIAKFWDCNPYVSTHKGHLMFATKKITPGAHWIGICKIACEQSKLGFNQTVAAYTQTSIAIVDAFISCWDEKYRSNLIRPETIINQHIDEYWEPVLQTPPFPEYTSGHSVVSGAASVVLTHIFGDDFAFKDTTEVPYGLPIRSFTSFHKAAEEAAISRLYGGIHYRAAIEVGLEQGRSLGKYMIDQVKVGTPQIRLSQR